MLTPRVFTLAGMLLVGPFMSAAAAEAREHQGSGNWQNSRGGSGTYQRSTTRENGSMHRESTWQNINGRSGSSALNRQHDREAGTWSSERSATRSNGDVANWNKTGQKTETGAVVHGEGSNFRGQEIDLDRAITHLDDGSRSVVSTYGNEATGRHLATETILTPTENGMTRAGAYTTGNGKTGTTSGGVVHDSDGTVRSNSMTTESGQTASRTVEAGHDDGSASRNVTTIGFDGDTRSRSTTLTPQP